MDYLNQETTANPVNEFFPVVSDFITPEEPAHSPTANGLNPRSVRVIVFAGDNLEPEFTRAVKEMRMGGEYLGDSCKTLMRYFNGFLRNCQLTPMTLGADYNNTVDADEDKNVYKVRRGLAYNLATGREQMTESYYREALPGHELASLMNNQQGGDLRDIGIREVKVLFNSAVSEPDTPEFQSAISELRTLQYKIFPEWADYLSGKTEFFKTNEALQTYLTNRQAELADDRVAVAVINTILESNRQFERYADARLVKMQKTIEAGRQTGDVYSWGGREIKWFEMLDITREDFMKKRSDVISSSPAISQQEFADQARKLDEMRETLNAVMPAIGQLAQLEVNRQKPVEVEVSEVKAVTPEKDEEVTAVCAELNARGEPCKGKVIIEVKGHSFCNSHQPKI